MSLNTLSPSAPFRPLPWRSVTRLRPSVLVLAAAVLVVAASIRWMPDGGVDWSHDIGPAARHWWPTPWLEGLPQLPWAALLLSPLGGLPDRLATAILNGVSLVSFSLVIRSAGGKDWMAIPMLVSPFGYWLFRNGQTDALMLAGLLFFNGLDLIMLLIKPQVALGVIVPRLRRSGVNWLGYLAPIGLVLIVSFVVWPGWPQGIASYASVLLPAAWNWAVWPYGLIVGLPLLWRAWQTGDDRLGVAATPLLFPYVNPPSYLGLLAMFAAWRPRWALFGCLMIWAQAGTLYLISRGAWPGLWVLLWVVTASFMVWLIGPDVHKGIQISSGVLRRGRGPTPS